MLRPQSTSVQLAIFASDLSRSHNNKHHHWLALQITLIAKQFLPAILISLTVKWFFSHSQGCHVLCYMQHCKIDYNQFTTGATWAWNWPQPLSSSWSSPSRWLSLSLLMAITNTVWQMATEWQLTRWIDEVDKVDHIEQFRQVDLGYKVEHHNQVDQVDQVD